ncbi:MAG: patatin-like phospholipase family protein, partial [Pseudomonadota bacterium]
MDSFVGQEAFVVFEGGGAKGVQHVATLKAIEENEFHVSGYAGASAGALVAALAAAGFKADEIFDPISKSHLLDDEAGTKRSALDLIGRGWPSIWVIGKLNNRPIEFFAFI